VSTTLTTDREDIVWVLDKVFRATEFAAVPDMVEEDVTIQTGLVICTKRMFGIPVKVEATIEAVDGQIEIDITKAAGPLKGIVRPLIESQVIARMGPWSAYVQVGKAPNGNLRFWRDHVRITSIHLGDDEVQLTLCHPDRPA